MERGFPLEPQRPVVVDDTDEAEAETEASGGVEEDAEWDVQLDRLMELLDKAKASGGMNFLEMDGFLHGITCLPGLIPPSVFIPQIFGDDDDAVLMSDAELAEAAKLILWWWSDIQEHVRRNHFFCEPWICPDGWNDCYIDDPELIDVDADQEIMDEAEAQDMPDDQSALPSPEEMEESTARLDKELREDASQWAMAFINALDMGGALDRIFEVERAEVYLIPALMLAKNQLPVEEDSPVYGQPLSDEDHEKALDLLPGSISALHRFLRRPVTKKAKISRNAPCPCGSGKKYKKCCL
ncbi:UPF0149 family protein [Desulfovibrio sp. OttesenSCG-928-G11]|nr:UPF0149 family protein [Desulfovibrio sp. OttesenSCG-928-G11]